MQSKKRNLNASSQNLSNLKESKKDEEYPKIPNRMNIADFMMMHEEGP